MSEQGVCPHCGSYYIERYSGWNRPEGLVTFHCFKCGIDYDVHVDKPEPEPEQAMDFDPDGEE